MDLRVLGPLQVVDGVRAVEVRGDRVRALLAVLLQRPDEVVSGDVLLEALWGDSPPATAGAALRMHASRLRQRLGPAGETGVDVVSQASGYRLAVERDCVDHVRFERLVEEARQLSEQGDGRGAVAVLQSALALWRGPAFADVDVPALTAMARHLDARLLEARDLLYGIRLSLGDSSELVADLEAAAAEHPEHERLTAHLMLALYRSGRQSDALAAFQRLRSWLGDELGLTPSAELTELEARVLRQDPDLAVAPVERRRPARRAATSAHALPPSLAAYRRGPFVGRDRAVAQLVGALRPAGGEEAAGLRCIVGPAGIGKSRLLAEVCGQLVADEVAVLHGWGAPGAPLPFGAFRMAIAPLLDGASSAGEPARALLDLMDGSVDLADRHRVQLLGHLDQLADALCDGEQVTTLLVLDDLQWADSLSLAALHHLARRAQPGLGLLAAARSDERTPAWTQFAADLSSVPGARLDELAGLDIEAVAALVDARDPDGSDHNHRRLAQRLVDATNGNPFYVTSAIDGLLEEQAQGPPTFSLDAPKLPVAAAGAIERRLQGLPTRTLELLGSAAVIGATFSLDLLAEVEGVPPDSVEPDLRPAVEAAVLSERTDDPDELTFDHELLRRAVLDGVVPTIMRSRHRAVSDALRARSADPFAVAYHLYRCLPLAEPVEVLDALGAAAGRALEVTAWEEAKAVLSAALEVWAMGDQDTATHIDLLVGMGRARMGAEGREVAMELFEQALGLALEEGHPEKVDDVLLAATRYYAALTPGDPVLEMIDRALHDDTRGQLGVRALTELIVHRCAASGATDDLVAMARHLRESMDAPDESEELLRAETYLRAGHPDVAVSLAIAERVIEITDGTAQEPTPNWLDGQTFALGFRLLAGDIAAVEADLPEFAAAADLVRLPVFQWLVPVARSSLALEAGRFAEADDFALQALSFGTEQQVPDTAAAYGFHLLIAAAMQGDLEAQVPMIEGAVAQYPTFLAFRAALAMALVRTGRHADGAVLLDDVAGRLEVEPRSIMTPIGVALVAWAGADIKDPSVAERLLPMVEPWSGTWPRTGLFAPSLGPIDRTIGLLQCLVGRREDGIDSLRHAVELADRVGAHPWSTWCQADLAQLDERGFT